MCVCEKRMPGDCFVQCIVHVHTCASHTPHINTLSQNHHIHSQPHKHLQNHHIQSQPTTHRGCIGSEGHSQGGCLSSTGCLLCTPGPTTTPPSCARRQVCAIVCVCRIITCVCFIITCVVCHVQGVCVKQHHQRNNTSNVMSTPKNSITMPTPHHRYIAVVSGLHVGDDAGNPLALSLLLDTLGGLQGAHDTQALTARITRVVIAGNLVHTTAPLASMGVVSGAKAQVWVGG